jgi:hypothetical protein
MANMAVIVGDTKQSEESLKHESVALPEEIDKGSMCDVIVGSSDPAKSAVLCLRLLPWTPPC